VSKTDFSGIF